MAIHATQFEFFPFPELDGDFNTHVGCTVIGGTPGAFMMPHDSLKDVFISSGGQETPWQVDMDVSTTIHERPFIKVVPPHKQTDLGRGLINFNNNLIQPAFAVNSNRIGNSVESTVMQATAYAPVSAGTIGALYAKDGITYFTTSSIPGTSIAGTVVAITTAVSAGQGISCYSKNNHNKSSISELGSFQYNGVAGIESLGISGTGFVAIPVIIPGISGAGQYTDGTPATSAPGQYVRWTVADPRMFHEPLKQLESGSVLSDEPYNRLFQSDSQYRNSEIFIFKSHYTAFMTNVFKQCVGPDADISDPYFECLGVTLPALCTWSRNEISREDALSLSIAYNLKPGDIPAEYNQGAIWNSIAYMPYGPTMYPICCTNERTTPVDPTKPLEFYRFKSNSNNAASKYATNMLDGKPNFGFSFTNHMLDGFTMDNSETWSIPTEWFGNNATRNGSWIQFGGLVQYGHYDGTETPYHIPAAGISSVSNYTINSYRQVGGDPNPTNRHVPQQSVGAAGSWSQSSEDGLSHTYLKQFLTGYPAFFPAAPLDSWLTMYEPGSWSSGTVSVSVAAEDDLTSGTGYSTFGYPSENGGYFDKFYESGGIWYAYANLTWHVVVFAFNPAQQMPWSIRPIKTKIANAKLAPEDPDIWFESDMLFGEVATDAPTVEMFKSEQVPITLTRDQPTSPTNSALDIVADLYGIFYSDSCTISSAWRQPSMFVELQLQDQTTKLWYSLDTSSSVKKNIFTTYPVKNTWTMFAQSSEYVQNATARNWHASIPMPTTMVVPAGKFNYKLKFILEYTSNNVGEYFGNGAPSGIPCRGNISWDYEGTI